MLLVCSSHVCYVFVLCIVLCAEETKSPNTRKTKKRDIATRREKRKSVTLQQDVKKSVILQLNSEGCITSDDLNLLRTAVKKTL